MTQRKEEAERFGSSARRDQEEFDSVVLPVNGKPVSVPVHRKWAPILSVIGFLAILLVQVAGNVKAGATKEEVAGVRTDVQAQLRALKDDLTDALGEKFMAVNNSIAGVQAALEALRSDQKLTDKSLAQLEARLAAVERELSRSTTRRQ